MIRIIWVLLCFFWHSFCVQAQIRQLKIAHTQKPLLASELAVSPDGKYLIFKRMDRQWESQPILFRTELLSDSTCSEPELLPAFSQKDKTGKYIFRAGTPFITYDGKQIYYEYDPKSSEAPVRDKGIWVYDIATNQHKEIIKSELATSPSVSPDGKSLYFENNGKILVSRKDAKGMWGTPIPLPAPVNSENPNEMNVFPKILEDNKTLLFSSNRSGSIGGWDLYATTLQPNGKWTLPVNLDSLNTQADESWCSISQNRILYFVRWRRLGDGRTNQSEVFTVRLPAKMDFNGLSIYAGNIYDNLTGEPFQLGELTFASNSSELNPAAKKSLEKLAKLLISKPNVILEIGAHTDDLGNDETNLQLSQRRAESVVAYLLDLGVPSKQMRPKGYGESQPKVPNTSEHNRKKNRRVEFKLIVND
ncbi:MAG: OmpA family protein [Cytophagales bacterium]|nr:OmpA family protein [Bernardetiaceae bacterium]MDW8205524.1 OmpA family protein [Cytophagales bacterium]